MMSGSKDEGSAMRIEMVPGTSNVVRFPGPFRPPRPSLETLREIAPDFREVLSVAEAFELECPLDEVRHQADAEMAVRIAESVPPEPGLHRETALADLLSPIVDHAIAACRHAHGASAAAAAAERRVIAAQTAEGGNWMDPLRDRAQKLDEVAARLLIEAYVAREQAEGAARAIGMAERNEPWQPFDLHAEANALFFGRGGPRASR
jgi:hypothetical protein